MPFLREKDVFIHMVRFLHMIHKDLKANSLLTCLEALSLFVDSEDFETHRHIYIPDADIAELLVEIKSECVSQFTADLNKKKGIRALIDCIDRIKRQYKL